MPAWWEVLETSSAAFISIFPLASQRKIQPWVTKSLDCSNTHPNVSSRLFSIFFFHLGFQIPSWLRMYNDDHDADFFSLHAEVGFFRQRRQSSNTRFENPLYVTTSVKSNSCLTRIIVLLNHLAVNNDGGLISVLLICENYRNALSFFVRTWIVFS